MSPNHVEDAGLQGDCRNNKHAWYDSELSGSVLGDCSIERYIYILYIERWALSPRPSPQVLQELHNEATPRWVSPLEAVSWDIFSRYFFTVMSPKYRLLPQLEPLDCRWFEIAFSGLSLCPCVLRWVRIFTRHHPDLLAPARTARISLVWNCIFRYTSRYTYRQHQYSSERFLGLSLDPEVARQLREPLWICFEHQCFHTLLATFRPFFVLFCLSASWQAKQARQADKLEFNLKN